MRSDSLRSAALPVVCLTVGLAGCGGYNSMFPRRDEIFKPIPVSLGDVRVEGADTSYVLRGPGYQVVTRDRELLPDAKSTLDRVASTWRQYFAAEPPPVTVVLRTPPRRGVRPDSAAPAANPGTTGVVLVAARRVDEDDPRAMRGAGMREEAMTLPVARAWLSALAGPAPAGTADTSTGRARPPFGRVDDPRVPDWIESAIPSLVGGAPDAELIALQLVEHPERLLPLRTLLASARSTAPGDSGRGRDMARDGRPRDDGFPTSGRGAQALGGPRLFDAEAVSVAAFLAEREGRPFVGRVVGALIGGGRVEEALKDATVLPRDVDGLDRAWRSWLETQAANARDRGRGRRA